MPDLAFEDEARTGGHRTVCGVDEAGRGPLAGPVVVAACILGPDIPPGLNDSKALDATTRERLFDLVLATSEVSVALGRVPGDPPRGGAQKPRDQPQRGGLAAAGRPEQRQEVARKDVEVHAP